MLLYLSLASHHGYPAVSEMQKDKAEAELQEPANRISELGTKIICWQWSDRSMPCKRFGAFWLVGDVEDTMAIAV